MFDQGRRFLEYEMNIRVADDLPEVVVLDRHRPHRQHGGERRGVGASDDERRQRPHADDDAPAPRPAQPRVCWNTTELMGFASEGDASGKTIHVGVRAHEAKDSR